VKDLNFYITGQLMFPDGCPALRGEADRSRFCGSSLSPSFAFAVHPACPDPVGDSGRGISDVPFSHPDSYIGNSAGLLALGPLGYRISASA
jgi:hypothetical protein